MATEDVAKGLTEMCRQGKFGESGERYWADNVVSVEPMGEPAEVRGKDAARGKSEWWMANHTVHGVVVEGPYVNGERFVVRFKMDVTPKASGQRISMDEVGLYTVKGDKVVREEFFYGQA